MGGVGRRLSRICQKDVTFLPKEKSWAGKIFKQKRSVSQGWLQKLNSAITQ
jgi:hypothetical protein